MFEVRDQSIFKMTYKIRLSSDWTLETRQSFTSHTPVLKGLIKAVEIAVAAKKLQVGIANDDIVGGRVVMELLMPLLEEMPGHFLHVMPVHDMKDLIANSLAVSAATDGSKHLPDNWPSLAFCTIQVRQPSS